MCDQKCINYVVNDISSKRSGLTVLFLHAFMDIIVEEYFCKILIVEGFN